MSDYYNKTNDELILQYLREIAKSLEKIADCLYPIKARWDSSE